MTGLYSQSVLLCRHNLIDKVQLMVHFVLYCTQKQLTLLQHLKYIEHCKAFENDIMFVVDFVWVQTFYGRHYELLTLMEYTFHR